MSEVPAGSLVIRTASPGESDLVLPEGLVHLGWIDDRAVGTFVLRWSDKQVWGPDDSDGGYVHRLATHPDAAGQGLGRRLLDVADELTARQGRHWLRLDCERGNQRLRAYYEALGFRYVRDEQVPRVARPGTRSASLYERLVSAPP